MLGIKDIFNVFSKRNKIKNEIEVSINGRNRIIMLIMEFDESYAQMRSSSYWDRLNMNTFCKEILKIIMMRVGRFDIIGENQGMVNGVLEFLMNCKGEEFLDFIEDSFKTDSFTKISVKGKNKLVEDVNLIFTIENIKFELTKYKEYRIEEDNWSKLESTTYPQIICKENIFINSEIIDPAIELLMDDRFKSANNEFLEGLEHYKNKRYKESIASSCCALESVMKIVSSINKWRYNDNATGLPLIKNIIENSQSPNWYEGIISPTLTIRNKLGPHGKGTNQINATKVQAQLQMNLVASQIIFLMEEYNK